MKITVIEASKARSVLRERSGKVRAFTDADVDTLFERINRNLDERDNEMIRAADQAEDEGLPLAETASP